MDLSELKRVLDLDAEAQRNLPEVLEACPGIHPAVAYSIAKYLPTLKRLANG